MQTTLERLFREEDGATAIEYGLIASLLVVFSLAAFGAFGAAVTGKFSYIENSVSNANGS